MKKKNLIGKLFAIALLASVVFGSTSCNRGYGCPYNVSVFKNIPTMALLIEE